jgi:PKD domain
MRPPGLQTSRALLLVVLAFAVTGCRRAAKPELGADRTVEAGMPVDFGSKADGAPELSWDFGQGASLRKGAHVSHAFARTGTFTVRALDADGEDELGRVRITVVPRPFLRAVPLRAEAALFVPRLRGNIEPLVDFFERLVGAENAQAALAQAPLVSLVLQSLSGSGEAKGVVDPEEGLGFFTLEEFTGGVALVGVTEPDAALDAVEADIREHGGLARRAEDGSVRIAATDGPELLAFVDRGYLYVITPERLEPLEDDGVQKVADGASEDVARVRALITGAQPEGLSANPRLSALQAKVAAGNLYFYAGDPDEQTDDAILGLWSAIKVSQQGLDVDGFAATPRPLFGGAQGVVGDLLKQAPEGAIAALQLSLPPKEMAALVFGGEGSPRRERRVARLKAAGIDPEALLGALRGDLAMLAYFDAPGFFLNLARSGEPQPRGSLLLDAGLLKAGPVLDYVTRQVERSPFRVETRKEKGTTRFKASVLAQPVELSVSEQRLALRAGSSPAGRASVDVAAGLRERFGGTSFGPGHLSVMLDVERLRTELGAVREVKGVSPQQLAGMQTLVGALLDQTPFDHAFLDLSPEESGARLKGRVTLRGQ